MHRLVFDYYVIQLLVYAPDFSQDELVQIQMKGVIPLEKYIGFGFVILCLAVLAGIIGVLGYQLHIDKEKADISPAKANISQFQNNNNRD